YACLSGSGFYNRAEGFRYVYALANAGGTDSATLYDSAGNDTLMGKPEYTFMYGANFHNCAEGFQFVRAHATAGGTDRAYLNDSAGDDRLNAADDLAQLIYGDGRSVSVYDFTWVQAVSSRGGTDTKQVETIDFVLQTPGSWID
ncbi:MAG: peptidase S8, partial [Pirellulales bacterium]|nr:peptidase S8 [Pirellulales bacterium]